MDIEEKIQEYETSAKKIPNEIFVTFKTSLSEKYQVNEEVMNISSGLTDRDLNELLNTLIQQTQEMEDETKYKFEFLLNDDFIKGSIKSHILKHQLNPELKFEISYTFALEKPELSSTIEEDEWITSIAKCDKTSLKRSSYVVGFFDGSIALYSSKSQLIGKKKVSQKAIKTVKVLERPVEGEDDESKTIISGSADELIRISRISETKKGIAINDLILCEGHDDSVESLDINPLDENMFCSAGYDRTLKIWKMEDHHFGSAVESASAAAAGGPRKKVKLSSVQLEPRSSSTLHLDAITQTIWTKPQSILTGSLDHTIKFYDTDQLNEALSINCKENIPSCLDYQTNLILSGQEDGMLKLWDERSDAKQPIKVLKAHSKWLSDVKFHPNNSNLFLSVSYDASIKLWDMRSTFPLITLKDSQNKLFAAEWNGDNDFLAGGADSKIVVYHFNSKKNRI